MGGGAPLSPSPCLSSRMALTPSQDGLGTARSQQEAASLLRPRFGPPTVTSVLTILLRLERAPPLVPRTDSLNSRLAGSYHRVPVVGSSRYWSRCASGWPEAWPPAGWPGTWLCNQAAGCVSASASGQGAHLPCDLDTVASSQCISPRPSFFFFLIDFIFRVVSSPQQN